MVIFFWNYVLRYEKLTGNMRIVKNLKKIMFLIWCKVSAYMYITGIMNLIGLIVIKFELSYVRLSIK